MCLSRPSPNETRGAPVPIHSPANPSIINSIRYVQHRLVRTVKPTALRPAWAAGAPAQGPGGPILVVTSGTTSERLLHAYNEVASIRDKDQFLIPFIEAVMNPHFNTGSLENDQTLLKSLIVFACMMEGLFFYVGFTQILALGRQNKMTGASTQYQYILRDESMHCNFGIDLINQIKLENPLLWTADFKAEIKSLFMKAVDLEYRYAEDTMPRGVLGMNASMFKGYLRYIANRRATQIGLEALFPNEENPFPWMSEMIDLKKEGNFFEVRVTEYQSGGALSWD